MCKTGGLRSLWRAERAYAIIIASRHALLLHMSDSHCPPPPGGGDSLHVATGAIPSAPRHGLFQSTADWLKVTLASIGATSTINPESYAYYPSPYIVP